MVGPPANRFLPAFFKWYQTEYTIGPWLILNRLPCPVLAIEGYEGIAVN